MQALATELQWLSQVIEQATNLHIANLNHHRPYDLTPLEALTPPSLPPDDLYGQTVAQHDLDFAARLCLALALAPQFQPQLLDIFLAKNPNYDAVCTEFGGVVAPPHRGVMPTGETVAFLLAGRDLTRRKQVIDLLSPQHPLRTRNLFYLEAVEDKVPFLSGKLLPHPELVQQLLYGQVLPPTLSPQFPARPLETAMEWEDLVVPESTREQLQDLVHWLQHRTQMREHPQLGKYMKPGYCTLFYGAPGTGKTLTASLLGKHTQRPVFLVDLSLVISKYIGETEKNLSQVFQKAEDKGWILFFDEADALFSRRTQTETSNDRHANQEVAYLLQRIEYFSGMVILATNLKQNIDAAFIRRFQSMVHFPLPKYPERLRIWQQHWPQDYPLAEDVVLDTLAKRYELSPAQISNVLQASMLQVLSEGAQQITRRHLLTALAKEHRKEGMIFESKL